MEVFTTIDQKNLNLASSSALGAETLGFNGIYTLENKHDPYLPLASATITTEKISLLTQTRCPHVNHHEEMRQF